MLRYEELLEEAGAGPFDYPELDERQAAALCYTSGTTGNPKGVLYSHRSISLHSSATLMTEGNGLSRGDRVLAVVPMFHANAWGLPYGAALAGADLILPDRFLGAEPLAKLIAAERPTLMGCVPTIFQDLLRYADEHPEVDLSSLTNAACGGSAVPKQLMKDFEERHGVRIFQAWGMTETSPVATYSRPGEDGEHDDALLGGPRQAGPAAAVGRAAPGRRRRRGGSLGRRVDRRDRGARAVDRLAATSATPTRRSSTKAGCAPATSPSADEKGFVQITDRSKDVIKSGGEWISSVELENELMAHPEVVEAAVIAKPDERWAERPLCCVVLRRGRGQRRRAGRAPARPRGEVVAARRVRVHRGDPEDERRQVRQEGAARPASQRAASKAVSRCPDGFGPHFRRLLTRYDTLSTALTDRHFAARLQAQAHARRTRGRSLRAASLRPSLMEALGEGRHIHQTTKTEVGMTRTDVMASSRPRTPGAALKRKGTRARRKLVALPILLLTALALVAPGTAFGAEEGTSGYNQEPNKPGTTTTTPTTPSTGTSPSKEEGTPATTPSKETEPTESSTSPAKEESKTLPFTGFDLRWSFGIGLLLMAAGFSIVGVQRRRRSSER